VTRPTLLAVHLEHTLEHEQHPAARILG
jgi:hypothetical protein